MAKDKDNLKELKKNYSKIEKQYNLPTFEELNQNFQIEKISDVSTDYLIREVRKFMADKFSNYLRFIETLLNPSNVPMFVFYFVKSINVDEKKKLSEAYKNLAKIEVNLIGVDIQFSEEKEAEFIKESYEIWQGIKNNILGVLNTIKINWDNQVKQNDKGYFG